MNSNPILDHSHVPGSYAHCFDASCPLAARCLPRLAADCLTDDVTQVMAVNPRRCSHDEQCPYFRPAEEVRMARGFMHALGTVPMANVHKVERAVMALYNRCYYYRMRRGTYALTPEQQEQIARILTENGAAQPVEFDAYEMELDW